MSSARHWLETRLQGAPETLRVRMTEALADTDNTSIADQLAAAAEQCMRIALKHPSERASALDLLAADALLTHACEAASEQGSAELARFVATWNAERFEQLL
jgi:hypothetical protein